MCKCIFQFRPLYFRAIWCGWVTEWNKLEARERRCHSNVKCVYPFFYCKETDLWFVWVAVNMNVFIAYFSYKLLSLQIALGHIKPGNIMASFLRCFYYFTYYYYYYYYNLYNLINSHSWGVHHIFMYMQICSSTLSVNSFCTFSNFGWKRDLSSFIINYGNLCLWSCSVLNLHRDWNIPAMWDTLAEQGSNIAM